MVKKYSLWLALSVLALAGCSRPERTPAAADTPAARPGPAARPAATEPAPPATAGWPAADTPASSPAAGRAETTRLLALLDGPRRRSATTLAAATPDTLAEAGPDSAGTAELRSFLLTGLPPAQVFTVRPGRDTLLLGAQGTQLLLPADAWALADTATAVRLELREFYTPADMVLAGLSTTAGPQLLETGGMLHLTATAQGQPVQLRPGAFVHLRMPAQAQKPGMQLFVGAAHGSGHVLDWQEPAALLPPTSSPPTRSVPTLPGRRMLRGRKLKARRRTPDKMHRETEANPPNYVRGERRFSKDLAATIEYPTATRARLGRGRRMSPKERRGLQDASEQYKERILQIVGVKFEVDSTGAIGHIESRADAELVAYITTALRSLPRWRPATFTEVPSFCSAPLPFGSGQAVNSVSAGSASRRLRIYFAESGKVRVVTADWDLKTTPSLRDKRSKACLRAIRQASLQVRQHLMDSLYFANRGRYDSLNAVQQARGAAELARIRTQFTDTSRAAITQQGVYNELSTQGLQWINCDRYLGPGPLITFGVRSPQAGAIVTLLFKGFRSVMSGEPVSAYKTAFRNVPLGRSAVIVAIRRENGTTYLATRTAIMGPLALASLSFHPVTMTELRTALNDLQ
jgi:hypothetical protein